MLAIAGTVGHFVTIKFPIFYGLDILNQFVLTNLTVSTIDSQTAPLASHQADVNAGHAIEELIVRVDLRSGGR
jgi:hypothetical protein